MPNINTDEDLDILYFRCSCDTIYRDTAKEEEEFFEATNNNCLFFKEYLEYHFENNKKIGNSIVNDIKNEIKNIKNNLKECRENISAFTEDLDLFHEAWMQDFNFPNKEKLSYRNHGGIIIYDEKHEISYPENWKTESLSKYVNYDVKINHDPKENKICLVANYKNIIDPFKYYLDGQMQPFLEKLIIENEGLIGRVDDDQLIKNILDTMDKFVFIIPDDPGIIVKYGKVREWISEPLKKLETYEENYVTWKEYLEKQLIEISDQK